MDSGHTKMKVSSRDEGKRAGSLADNVIKEGSMEGVTSQPCGLGGWRQQTRGNHDV